MNAILAQEGNRWSPGILRFTIKPSARLAVRLPLGGTRRLPFPADWLSPGLLLLVFEGWIVVWLVTGDNGADV